MSFSAAVTLLCGFLAALHFTHTVATATSAAATALHSSANAGAPLRNTTDGPVSGIDGGNLATFHGLPYAAPPIGVLRFRAPQPVAPWTSVRNVSALPPICPQFQLIDNSTIYAGEEDCLYLHLYQPTACNATHRCAVMVFIPGGAFILGDGYEFGFYDGTNLAVSGGVVVVSVNYRQGPLGFMALDALQAEDPDHSTGNAALQDQRAALLWVKANAAAFGGDPSQVTLFGESAGGFSVSWHLVSPLSAGLFRAVIIESGSSDSPQIYQTLEEAIAFNTLYAGAIGCPSSSGGAAQQLACLRALPTGDVTKGILDWWDPNWPYKSVGADRAGTLGRLEALRAFFAGMKGGAPQLPSLAPVMPWGPAVDGSPAGLLVRRV